MWYAVERANSLFIIIALDSETKHRRQKEPVYISKHIACPLTGACLFKPSLCACSQLLDLTPNFLTLGVSAWALLLPLCSLSCTGSSYQSEQELHFCTALTAALIWESSPGHICQCRMFVQGHIPLIRSTTPPCLLKTLWATVPYSLPAQYSAFFSSFINHSPVQAPRCAHFTFNIMDAEAIKMMAYVC